MSEHTDGARRAAAELVLMVWGEKKGYEEMVWIDHKIKEFATIIDRETGLPEITAERDRLLGDVRAAYQYLGSMRLNTGREDKSPVEIRLEAALAKEPESKERKATNE